jgi:hypothetical protein
MRKYDANSVITHWRQDNRGPVPGKCNNSYLLHVKINSSLFPVAICDSSIGKNWEKREFDKLFSSDAEVEKFVKHVSSL